MSDNVSAWADANEKSQIDTPMSFPGVKEGNKIREYIWTFTGKRFFFDKPEEAINITDIAHALSMICRWTGHVKRFYSVAEHCVRCSQYDGRYVGKVTEQPRYALRKLLHDAPEAWIQDVNKPLKNLLSVAHATSDVAPYDAIEARIERAVWTKFGLGVMGEEERKEVKAADLAMAMTEARDLLNQTSITHYEGAKAIILKNHDELGWSPSEAEEKFKSRFLELM